MIGVTYEEAGLAIGFNRNLEQVRRQAQSVIDRQDDEIDRLQRELSILRAQNAKLQAQVEASNLETNLRILRNRIRH